MIFLIWFVVLLPFGFIVGALGMSLWLCFALLFLFVVFSVIAFQY